MTVYGSFTDEGLVGKAQSGDRQAEEQLITRYRKVFNGRLYDRRKPWHRIIADPERAETAVQDALLALLGAIENGKYDPSQGRLYSYAWMVAYRVFCRIHRELGDGAVEVHTYILDEDGEYVDISEREADPGPDPGDIVSDRLAMAHALAQLDPDDRELLIKIYVNDVSRRDLANELGIRYTALTQRLTRARKELQATLTEMGAE